jgi:hypothetical protein
MRGGGRVSLPVWLIACVSLIEMHIWHTRHEGAYVVRLQSSWPALLLL